MDLKSAKKELMSLGKQRKKIDYLEDKLQMLNSMSFSMQAVSYDGIYLATNQPANPVEKKTILIEKYENEIKICHNIVREIKHRVYDLDIKVKPRKYDVKEVAIEHYMFGVSYSELADKYKAARVHFVLRITDLTKMYADRYDELKISNK